MKSRVPSNRVGVHLWPKNDIIYSNMLTNIFSLLRPLVLYFCLRAKNYSVVKSWSKSILNLVHLHVTIVVTVLMTVEGKGARLTVNLPVIFVILHESRLQDPEIGIIQDIINLRIIGEDLVTTLGKVKNLTWVK